MSSEIAEMILRCAKTGKLFFNEKDAKQHNDDTGFAEFEQVSPDDKVWFCVETGKVCITQIEMTLYQKRDPTAKTFEEKTITFLKARHLARKQAEPAAEGDAERMDIDEGAPAAAPDPPNISKETVEQLLEMGFPQPRVERALVRTGNSGLEAAITWLGEHADDADIDDPLALTPNILLQADLDAARAAKSVNAHLSADEKAAKLQAAVEAAQRKKAEAEREDEKVREKARRESGKHIVKTKAEMDDLQRKRDRDARKKEKEDDIKHRLFLREQLEQDKADRRAARERAGLPPLANDAPKPVAAPEPPAAAPPPSPAAPATPAAPAAPRVVAELPVVPVADAIGVLLKSSRDFLLEGFVETAGKLAENMLKHPTEDKYRRIKLSNPKIHERLIRPTGGELFLRACGWTRAGDELSLPAGVSAEAMAAGVAQLGAQADAAKKARGDAERLKLKEERDAALAAKNLEKERLRAAMEADRREISARGPSQSIRATALPSNHGGLAVNRLNLEEDPEDNRPQA